MDNSIRVVGLGPYIYKVKIVTDEYENGNELLISILDVILLYVMNSRNESTGVLTNALASELKGVVREHFFEYTHYSKAKIENEASSVMRVVDRSFSFIDNELLKMIENEGITSYTATIVGINRNSMIVKNKRFKR